MDVSGPFRGLFFILGGGPQLLPKLTAKEEAFIRVGNDGKQVDSIGCNKTAARTAIGITVDDHFLILCLRQRAGRIFLRCHSRTVSSALEQPWLHQSAQFRWWNFDNHSDCRQVVHGWRTQNGLRQISGNKGQVGLDDRSSQIAAAPSHLFNSTLKSARRKPVYCVWNHGVHLAAETLYGRSVEVLSLDGYKYWGTRVRFLSD